MQWLERCLSSVKNSSVKTDLFIVDNGSTDGSRQFIAAKYPEAKLILSDENLGFGRANNIGLQYAKDNDYDFVYLLNQDAWIEPQTLRILTETSKAHPMFGILSPMHIDANGKEMFDYCRDKSNCYQSADSEFTKPVFEHEMIPAAHWLIPRHTLLKVGGFSPTFPHYGEDNNYVDRLYFHALKTGVVPSTIGVHDSIYNAPATTEEKREYFKYIYDLVVLSHPTCKRGNFQFLRYLVCGLRGKSHLTKQYVLRLIRERCQILRNRHLSRMEGAFLQ